MQTKQISFQQIAKECSIKHEGRTVVFTYTRADAEKLHHIITANAKCKAAQSAMLYHGQVEYSQREKVQK
eukprot:3934487-Rhodomonas_salina.1